MPKTRSFSAERSKEEEKTTTSPKPADAPPYAEFTKAISAAVRNPNTPPPRLSLDDDYDMWEGRMRVYLRDVPLDRQAADVIS